MNEHVGVTLDVLPGTLGGITAALGGFNELVAATSMLTSKIAQSTSAVDSMLLTLGVGLAAAGYEAAKAAGEVERSMKIVQSVSGQTASEISVLTQAANDLSVKYKMGIDEITDGLTTLGRAGLSSVNTQLETMKGGLEAAKITGLELDDVLNKIVQTTALLGGDINSSSFGLESQALTSKILATSQSAPIDMNDVVQTLSYSGGTAAAGGINIYNEDALYDYLGTIAAFGQKGVSGSMAGTALRAFFTKPASQSTSVTEALGELGMKPEDLWEDGGNKIRPVSEQIGLIQKQMDKLKISQMDQIELWGRIVSPKMGQQMLKLNKDSIQNLAEDIRQTETAEQLAQNTMNNFMSDLNTLGQQGQKAWRELGETALAWIGPVIKGLNGLMSILGYDIGGFPIFQQFFKAGLIIVISQIIQKLGAVWNLFKGIGNELRNQLGGLSQVERHTEQTEAGLIKQYQTMGLSESQAKTLAKDSENIHTGFSASNKVLAEFLAKLNEAVALMGKLSTLSQVNSMNMIGNMTGDQYTKYYGKAKDYNKNAWYSYAYSRGDLTKTDFAKLSLRHGLSQDELQKIYYGTHKTHGAGLYEYALKNQTGFADAMKKGENKGFITATTLEKYLQEKQIGMYDPKTNPMMALVQHISTNTDTIARKTNGSQQDNPQATAEKGATATHNAKTQALDKQEEVAKEENVLLEQKQAEIKTAQNNEESTQLATEKIITGELTARERHLVQSRELLVTQQAKIQEQIAIRQEEINALQTVRGYEVRIARLQSEINALEAEDKSVQSMIVDTDIAILRAKRQRLGRESSFNTSRDLLNNNQLTRYSIAPGTTPENLGISVPGPAGGIRNAMLSGFSGMRNFDANKGLAYNWFWNAGTMQMVNRDAVKTATANMGKLGKVAGVAGGALSSLGMMFGPVEIAMMGLSVVMQGLQVAYENYQKELEEINSELSEAREKIKEAEEAFTSAYDEANPNATQDEKDEALLDAYAGDTSASKDDGLQTYRDKLYAQVAAIEVNTRKKADKELHPIWGESGDWEKQKDSIFDSIHDSIIKSMALTGGLPGVGDIGLGILSDKAQYVFNPTDSDAAKKDYEEQLKAQAKNAEQLGNSESQINSADYIVSELGKSLDISSDKLDKTLNKYPDWIARQEDKSESAKYARSIMAEGIDSMGPTQGKAYEGIWGSGASSQNLAQYYKMQSEAMQLTPTDKNILMNAINDNEDFLKSMQKMYFKDSKQGKLVGTDEKTETKILRAIQNRLGGISRAQAKIALTLAAVSEIQKVVSEQVQPTLMSHMEAAWEGVAISSGTQDQVGGTWSTTSAVQQGVSIISAQMARLLQQKAFELGSMKAEMAGIDMKDLDALRLAAKEDPNRTSITINGHTYDKDAISDAVNIFSGMETAPYEAIALQRGEDPDKAREWALKMKEKLDENGARASAVWETQAKGLQYYLDPIITDAYLNSMKDSDAKATGAADSGKDKDKNKDKDSSANRKNWVNLAICNKKEIPKLNVNLFKKPPNFTILNRNFKLRDVNVNTADDAKSIQNAVKNSIIEIQNRSNPKIIQDDAAEYDPVNATEGNNIPTGTKKTE